MLHTHISGHSDVSIDAVNNTAEQVEEDVKHTRMGHHEQHELDTCSDESDNSLVKDAGEIGQIANIGANEIWTIRRFTNRMSDFLQSFYEVTI